MLPARGLLAATALLLLLVGGVWYSNRQEAKKQDAPAADAPPRLLSIPVAKLRTVTVDRDTEHFSVERSDKNEYKITEPAALPADTEAAAGLFLQFSALDTERLVDDKPANLSQFGLDPPKGTFTATRTDGTKVKVLLGETSPTGTSTYAKVDGESRVVTLSQMIASGFEKSLKDLRDKRLIPFDRGSIKSISITGKGGPVNLNAVKAGWQVSNARADAAPIEDLLRELAGSLMDPAAKADAIAEAAKAWTSSAPVGTVRVADGTGTHELEVRRTASKDNEKSKDSVYLKSPVIEGIHKGTVGLADAVAKSADQYRNLRVLDFGFDDPSRVEIKDGPSTRVLTQSEAKWNEAGKEIDSVSAQSLVDKLRELKATSIRPNGGGAPDMELTVVSSAGQRTEHVVITKDGSTFVARREGEPQYYVLDAKAVSELRQTAADVKAAPPAAKKK